MLMCAQSRIVTLWAGTLANAKALRVCRIMPATAVRLHCTVVLVIPHASAKHPGNIVRQRR